MIIPGSISGLFLTPALSTEAAAIIGLSRRQEPDASNLCFGSYSYDINLVVRYGGRQDALFLVTRSRSFFLSGALSFV